MAQNSPRVPIPNKNLSTAETSPIKHVGFSLTQRFSIIFGAPIFYLFGRKKIFLSTLITAGEISEFLKWQQNEFSSYRFFLRKVFLYNYILKIIKTKNGFVVFEFGAAHGEKTNFISKNSNIHEISTINSFDRFIGLPRAWRDMQEGSFTNHGKLPRISDDRINWYKGDVEKTLGKVDKKDLGKPLFIIFDLDIYEPTYSAYIFVKPYLKEGDIVYFDEAFDEDENRILKQFLKDFKCKLIGTTGMAIALEVVEKNS